MEPFKILTERPKVYIFVHFGTNGLNTKMSQNSSRGLIRPTEQSEKNKIEGEKKSGISYFYVRF